MIKSIVILLLTICATGAYSQTGSSLYDSTLAKSLGADDYGMKSYILVILKTGPNEVADKIIRDSLFRGHFDNINRLAEVGKLVVAGPFGKNDKSYRGIFILDVETVEEAQELVISDPTIKEKIFDVEFLPWYGSAALPTYLDMHKRIEKSKP